MFDILNLKGIPNYYCSNKKERYELATKQESLVTERLKITYPSVDWGLTRDMLLSTNNELNRVMGDIIGFKDNKLYCAIDLKVSASKDLNKFGGIDLNAYFGFFYNAQKRFIIMSNYDGSKFLVVTPDDIDNLIRKNIKFIERTKNNRREKFMGDIGSRLAPYYVKPTDFVATHDYIDAKYLIKPYTNYSPQVSFE